MRTTTFLIGIIAVSTQLLSATTSHGQGSAETTISIDVRNTPMRQVFQTIEEKADVVVMYENTAALRSATVTYTATDKPVGDILDALLLNRGLRWSIRDHVIRVEPTQGANEHTFSKTHDGEPSTPSTTNLILAYPEVRGRVVDSLGQPLAGASIRVLNAEGKRTTLQTTTDRDGYFLLRNVPEEALLEITYVGYVKQMVTAGADVGSVVLNAVSSELEEVEVMVSTGYQTLPKERATGSFVQIDNELLNRSNSTDIISRLEGVTDALVFDYRRTPDGTSPDLRVRGLSSIHADKEPLIILDNFPYDGDILNINPNDVESITVLKDAAAASIWGARAGNGVIVINSKKGKSNQPLTISARLNTQIEEKLDLEYNQDFLTSLSYIEVEKIRFERGLYAENDWTALSPAVELFIKERDHVISESELSEKLSLLGKIDVREQASNLLYRNPIRQQYSLNAYGGSDRHRYYVSTGYDHNSLELVGNAYQRLSIRASNTFSVSSKLNMDFDLSYAKSNTKDDGIGLYDIASGTLYPYASLVNEDGSFATIPFQVRTVYAESAEENGLLNWGYRPLQEQQLNDRRSEGHEIRLNTGLSYQLFQQLSLSLKYQYQRQLGASYKLDHPESFRVRDNVNRFTQADGRRIFPEGGILENQDRDGRAQSGRLQLDFNQNFNKDHGLNAIAGVEAREVYSDGRYSSLYGYDPDILISQIALDFETYYPTRPRGVGRLSQLNSLHTETIDRYVSAYANMSYTFQNRYVFSGSARWDGSNLFGVNANQKGVPLWSIGALWHISNEKNWSIPLFRYLALRATYGFSGNIDRSLTAYNTATYSSSLVTELRSALIRTPGNPSLRWEKVSTTNVGVDFRLRDIALEGGIEYFIKEGSEMLGDIVVDPTKGYNIGFTQPFRMNNSEMRTQGIDLKLTLDLPFNPVSWRSDFLFNRVKNKVTRYYGPQNLQGFASNYGVYPLEGQSLDAFYSVPWFGLSPDTGDPLVMVNGELNTDYDGFYRTLNSFSQLQYSGLTFPSLTGSWRNTFTFRNLALSFNLVWKGNYHFRRSSINYQQLLYFGLGHVDYDSRWKVPGDELTTQIPSLPSLVNVNRDNVLLQSDLLIERGDHIRLQDVNLSYYRGAYHVYLYVRRPALLWTANKRGIDPDFVGSRMLRGSSVTLGVNLKF